ncbi:g5996 [Coccomyxa elongata]
MSGFGEKYTERRQHLRDTWFPNTQQDLDRLEQETGIHLRFALGEVPEDAREEIAAEQATHGAFLHIPLKDDYMALSYKTLALWRLTEERFEADYVIKVDDDNYVRLDRLATALGQWSDMGAEYIGCFKTRRSRGNTTADPTQRWHDPHHRIFEEDHSRYAEGPFYALRGRVISAILRAGLAPRLGGPEDMMVGALMKAFNVTWYDDRRLCHMEGCTPAMIGFKWDHAVRDFMDHELRAPTLCCLSQASSQQVPPVDECTDPSQYHQEGLRCLHLLHTDATCASPTLTDGQLPLSTFYNYSVDHQWIADRAPPESNWRFFAHGHARRGTGD